MLLTVGHHTVEDISILNLNISVYCILGFFPNLIVHEQNSGF